jgi:glycosyltransferase involved in cell wall biosynthesis
MAIKICVVTTAFPRWSQDDRGVFVLEAARALQAQGAQVRVVAMHSPHARTREIIDNLEVIRPRYFLPERFEVLQKDGGGLPMAWRKYRSARVMIFPFFFVHASAIARYARGCDIIHANWTLSGAAAWVSQCIHRRPIILTVQGSDIFQAAHIPLFRQITQITLKRCNRILALSHSLAQDTQQLGVLAEKIEIVPNGVDVRHFTPTMAARQPCILFVGSLIERKGVGFLLQAWARLATQFPAHQLVIIGEGSQHDALVDLARTLGIAPRVRFLGTQSPLQVSEWMRQAQLFVLPSLEEGQGVVLVEALASGTPCVGSNVGGIPDVITPEVGTLVPPRDIDALADAIRQILSNREDWGQLSVQARRRAVEHYSWDVIGKRLMNIYQSVLSAAGET